MNVMMQTPNVNEIYKGKEGGAIETLSGGKENQDCHKCSVKKENIDFIDVVLGATLSQVMDLLRFLLSVIFMKLLSYFNLNMNFISNNFNRRNEIELA